MIVDCALDHTFLRMASTSLEQEAINAWNIWSALAKPKLALIPLSFPLLVRAQPVPDWPHDRGGIALQSPNRQESLQSFPGRFGACISK